MVARKARCTARPDQRSDHVQEIRWPPTRSSRCPAMSAVRRRWS